jgi:zinc ribbon protein
MAATGPTRYCGRCGAPLAPGATYCGRCGTPVQMAAAAAPMYRYPPPPSPGYRPAGQYKMGPALIAGGLILIVLVGAVAIGGIALSQFVNGSHSTCTSNCAPKVVAALPEEASWHSSRYHFTVNYSSAWTVRTEDASGVTLGTKLGSVSVVGSSGGTPDQAMQSTINALPSAKFQDVTLVASLHGAHIGDQDGVGEVFSANLLGASQTATKVRFAVIAASRAGVTIVVFALDPADPKSSPNGMPEGQAFDYLCTEFAWS